MAGLTAGGVLAAGLVAAGVGVFVGSRRQGRAGTALATAMAAVCVWNLAYGGELLATDPGWRLALGNLKYLGICGLVPAWLAFLQCWTGRGPRVTGRLLAALLVEPGVLFALLTVPSTRDLVRYLPAGAVHPLTVEVATGPVFWVNLIYTDLLLLPATALFVGSLVRHSRAYWLQAGALSCAALLPWAANLLFSLAVGPFGRLDLTSVMFTLTGAVLAWGLFQQRLLRLNPLARSLLVDRMTDGVVVLDAHGRITDVNPAARALCAGVGGRQLGALGADVLPELFGAAPPGSEVVLRRGAGPRTYEVTDVDLPGGHGHPAGRLLVLRDITERSRLEQQLRDLLADRARVAEQLSSSLRPPSLPAVPGVQLAACFRPAGTGQEIGGDFYDVVAVRDEWAFALGDVSGKGAKAAAVTAHARYTLRTLVLAGAQPAAALEQLHRLLVGELDDETYLTVAHGRLRPHPGGVSVVLALGGHPQPLVVRAGGDVEPVGRPGSAIGLFEHVEVTETAVQLAPRDALFLFTDGVSEARPDGAVEGAMFGEGGLAAALSRVAGRDAQQLAEALLADVLGLRAAEPADDIALLVLQAGAPAQPAPPPAPRQPSEPHARAG